MIVNKKISYIVTIVLFFLLLASHAAIAAELSQLKSKYQKKKKYVIGPEDILKIYIWKQPDLTMTVPVRIDGKISLPLINDVQAAGITPHQLKDRISKKLAKFIEEPTVSIIVQAINSKKIIICGSVRSPGVYKIRNEINILEAISIAGGLGEFANSKKIKIIRKKDRSEKIYEINYSNILNGKDLKQNVPVFPGDTIIVP